MKIGFTSTSFRQIKSIEKIVKIASDAGADCIEWGGDVHVPHGDLAIAREAAEKTKKADLVHLVKMNLQSSIVQ